MKAFLAALAALAIALPAAASSPPPGQRAEATLKTADGTVVGSAVFEEGTRGVLIRLYLTGLKPGWHGLHFHEKGDCSSEGFKSAGSHVHDGTGSKHGLLNIVDQTESGDLPNVFVGDDGTAHVDLFTTFVSFNGLPGRPALYDADGSALVVHDTSDDYLSQPIGGAGARIACGVLGWAPVITP